jgi:plasmid stabilization system protein ParE
MKAVRFSAKAADDLHAIIAHYGEVAPYATSNVLSDIFRSIQQVSQFPNSGAPVPNRNFRKAVSLKYQFKIIYITSDGALFVLGVFRHQGRES